MSYKIPCLFAAIVLLAAGQFCWAANVTEEFHHAYPVGPHARISLKNINGDVEFLVADGHEVRVDAVKTADASWKLEEVQIDVTANSSSVSIETVYDHRKWSHNDPGSVDYRVTVPRDSDLDSIDLVNGKLNIDGVRGDVSASVVNGTLHASGLAGETKLSTVNGKLEAFFDDVDGIPSISLSSVNGSLVLKIPEQANASFHASTISGNISNDFGFSQERQGWVGHNLSGTLGKGTTQITLSNVNGAIELRRP